MKNSLIGYDSSDTLFYVDPPYVGAENCYKITSGFGINEHENLAKILANVKGKL